MTHKRIITRLLAGVSMLSAASVAHGQTTSADAVTTDDIIVTALKREQNLLEVPATVTVLAGDALRDNGVINLADLQNVVPGVNIATGRDGVTVNVRGVTTTDTSSKGEQDVAFNVDGVYIGRGNARGAAFFDVDRIEVLRGPQGTLYGRSSTGGAINVITKAPVLDEVGGYVRAEYGNYQTKRGEGAINLPLGSTLALRISGAFNQRDGYSKPISHTVVFGGTSYSFDALSGTARNDQSDAAGRASLLFEPNDALRLRLTATIGHTGGAGQSSALETQLKANGDHGGAGLNILASPVKAFVDSDFENYDGHLNYDFGGVSMEVMAAYSRLKHLQQGPQIIDPTHDCCANIGPVPGFLFFYQKNDVKTKQAEVRFTNSDPGVIEYVVGANIFDESAGESGQSWATPATNPTNYASAGFQNGPVNVTTHKSHGFFGQATWNVDDKLSVVGGLRYTHNKVDRKGRFSLPFQAGNGDVAGNAICTYPNPCLGGLVEGGSKDSKVTFKAGVNYKLTPDDLIYVSVASGFKGGTFNDFDPAFNGPGPVPPSSIVAYEIGYKGRPLPGLTLASTAFYYDFSKYAISGGVQFPNGTNVQYTAITPIKFYGWENEFTYRLASQTTFDGSFTLLKTEFVNYVAGQFAPRGLGRDLAGQAIDMAPEFTVNAGISHAIDVGEDGKIRMRAAIKYSDGYWVSNLGNAVRYWQPSFTRSNANISYEFDDAKYSIQFFVENIENKVQRVGIIQGLNGAPYGGAGGSTGPFNSSYVIGNGSVSPTIAANRLSFSVTTPRFYGVRLAAKF